MLILLFILLVVTSYAVPGVFIARKQHTINMRKYGQRLLDYTPDKRTDSQILKDFGFSGHKSFCNVNYQYLRASGCDCDPGKVFIAKKRRELAPPAEPNASVAPVVSWPFILLKNFISAGANQLPDYQVIARYEREVKELS